MITPDCEVCGMPAIGKAPSALGGLNVFLCLTCLAQGAEPEWVFELALEDTGVCAEWASGRKTFRDGKYISWDDWKAGVRDWPG